MNKQIIEEFKKQFKPKEEPFDRCGSIGGINVVLSCCLIEDVETFLEQALNKQEEQIKEKIKEIYVKLNSERSSREPNKLLDKFIKEINNL